MQPSLKKTYRMIDLTVYNVITDVIRYLCMKDVGTLSLVNKDFQVIVPEVVRLLKVDFSTLPLPWLGYEIQTEVSKHRVDMAGAAMI